MLKMNYLLMFDALLMLSLNEVLNRFGCLVPETGLDRTVVDISNMFWVVFVFDG